MQADGGCESSQLRRGLSGSSESRRVIHSIVLIVPKAYGDWWLCAVRELHTERSGAGRFFLTEMSARSRWGFGDAPWFVPAIVRHI